MDKSKSKKLGFLQRLRRMLKISCPNCKVGKLTQNEIHKWYLGGEVNVYTCDNCDKKYV